MEFDPIHTDPFVLAIPRTHALARAGINLTYRFEVSHIATLLGMVDAGRPCPGCWVWPRGVASPLKPAGD